MDKLKYIILSLFALIILLSFTGFSKGINFHYHAFHSNDNQDYLCGVQNEDLQRKIIEWLGTPYKSGSNTINGTDCSGFVQMIFREVYSLSLTHSSQSMIHEVKVLSKKTTLKEGDILFFKTWKHRISHVGIYLSDGMFVHASTSNGVEIASLKMPYYKHTFYKAGRVLELY